MGGGKPRAGEAGPCVAPVSRGPRLGWRPRGLCRGPRCSEAGGEVPGAAAAGSALGAATRGSCVRSGWVVAPVLARPGLAWERPRARVVELGREEPQHPPGTGGPTASHLRCKSLSSLLSFLFLSCFFANWYVDVRDISTHRGSVAEPGWEPGSPVIGALFAAGTQSC